MQISAKRDAAVSFDDTFEHIAVFPADRNGGSGIDFFLSGKGAGQYQVLLDGLPGERRVQQYGITPEEFINKTGGITFCNFNAYRQFTRNRIGRFRYGLRSGTQVASTSAFVDIIGIDHRLMPVSLVNIIRIDGISGSLKTADLTAKPHISR